MLERLLSWFERVLISVGLGVATVLMFANVVARYVFNTGIPWVLEAVQYLFAWVVLIGAAHGFKAGIHLGIELVVEKFPPATRRWLALTSLGLSLLFVVWVLVMSVEYTLKIYQWGDLTLDLRIPQWIPYLAIPVGLTLMTIRLLQIGRRIWIGEIEHIARGEHARFEGQEIDR